MAVELNVLLPEIMDENVVFEAFLLDSSVKSRDPNPAELPGALPAVIVGILTSM